MEVSICDSSPLFVTFVQTERTLDSMNLLFGSDLPFAGDLGRKYAKL